VTFDYPHLRTTGYNNQRWYDTPYGHYPSITTVLGATESAEKKASLQAWRDAIGHEEADRITREAADRGTVVHLLCERFLKGEKLDDPIDGQPVSEIDMATFNTIKLKVSKITEVWGQEVALYSRTLELAGRCDLIAVYKGRPVIIDFKTSRKIKNDDDIHGYKLQLCFYAQAHNEMFGTNIEEGVIIMSAGTGFPMEFTVPLKEHLLELKKRAAAFWQDAIENA
jgi:genome maintenance exonuclease 1